MTSVNSLTAFTPLKITETISVKQMKNIQTIIQGKDLIIHHIVETIVCGSHYRYYLRLKTTYNDQKLPTSLTTQVVNSKLGNPSLFNEMFCLSHIIVNITMEKCSSTYILSQESNNAREQLPPRRSWCKPLLLVTVFSLPHVVLLFFLRVATLQTGHQPLFIFVFPYLSAKSLPLTHDTLN